MHVVSCPRAHCPGQGVTPEMTLDVCRGRLRGVGVRDRGACSLELDETQSLTLALERTLGVYQQEEMSVRGKRGSRGRATSD